MNNAGYHRSNGGQLEGRYVNYFEIGHNACEFILDFGQLFSGDPEAGLHTRLITNPVYARELAAVLTDALRQYEERYSRCPDQSEGNGPDQALGKKADRASILKIV